MTSFITIHFLNKYNKYFNITFKKTISPNNDIKKLIKDINIQIELLHDMHVPISTVRIKNQNNKILDLKINKKNIFQYNVGEIDDDAEKLIYYFLINS
jgi:hypothetical protein